MANQEHVKILKQGVEVWNKWREDHFEIEPDLRGANLKDANLVNANLWKADLRGVHLENAHLENAILAEANLKRGHLKNAHLVGTHLGNANLGSVDLQGANLKNAILERATLVKSNLTGANLTGCQVYGLSVWDVHLEGAIQKDLLITPIEEVVWPNLTLYPSLTLYPGISGITIDNLEMAQFINLLLNNQKIRDVIDTITSKVVLILGRFTDERKPVLDALRDELRKYNFSPVVFDFEKPNSRNLTETISTLAHLSRFVIADLTDAKSIPQELEKIVPHLPSVPIRPILQKGTIPYAMFEDYEQYPQVMPIYPYLDIPHLLTGIKEHIITPVEQKKDWKAEKRMLEEKIKMQEEEIKRLKGGK